MARNKATALLVGAVAVIAFALVALPVLAGDSGYSTVEYALGLEMNIYGPTADGPLSGKAVIAVHGGGWYSGTPMKVDRMCRALTAEGAICFAPEYTLSGKAPYPRPNHDLLDAIDYIRAEGWNMPLGAFGSSSGGCLVGWLANRGVVDVAVTWSAPSKLPGLSWDSPVGNPVVKFAPTAAKRTAASPALRSMDVPLLVVSSDHEFMPLGQANALYRAGTAEKHLTVFPGSNHAMNYFDQEVGETVAWFETYL
jgi:esterase/lipase